MAAVARDKVGVFLDGGYLDKVLEYDFGRPQVDYGLLVGALCGGSELLRAYYYHCPPYLSRPPTEPQKKRQAAHGRFVNALKKIHRFEYRQGHLSIVRCSECGFERFRQKRIDTMLSVDLTKLSARGHIQRAALVTGDDDLVPAVVTAKDSGVIVRLYYSEGSISDELLTTCDEPIPISQALIDQVLKKT